VKECSLLVPATHWQGSNLVRCERLRIAIFFDYSNKNDPNTLYFMGLHQSEKCSSKCHQRLCATAGRCCAIFSRGFRKEFIE
jgi:hypothetical protein